MSSLCKQREGREVVCKFTGDGCRLTRMRGECPYIDEAEVAFEEELAGEPVVGTTCKRREVVE